ncbi:MAG: hypothetical protein KC549_12235, partial [Myxococcales bacterium]|nr:hypothetical protein [Myxococcales bacterium]
APKAPAAPPALSAALSGAHTIGFAHAAHLDAVVAWADGMAGTLPPAILADAPPPVTDPAARTAALGFDTTTAAGWASVGVDAAAGVGFFVDARLPQKPILALQVTDEAKFMGLLTGKAGATLTGDGPVRTLTIGKATALVARRGAWTLALPDADPAADTAAFTQVATEDATLGADATFRAAFADAPADPIATAWLSTSRILAHLQSPGSALNPDAAFFAERFPAIVVAVGRDDGLARVLADDAARQALGKMFTPATAPPALSAHAQGPVSIRADVNFGTFLTGLTDLFPPSRAAQKAKALQAAVALPLAVGFTVEELDAAFSGHILASVPDLQRLQGGQASFVVALGLRDAARFDALLDRGLKLAESRAGVKGTTEPFGDATGYVFAAGPVSLAIVRRGDVVFVGEKASVSNALASKPAAPEAVRQKLDQPQIVGVALDLAAAAALAPAVAPDSQSTFQAGLKIWAQLGVAGWLVANIRLDGQGIRFGEGPAGALMPGVLAAVAIPAFLKYIRRAKSSEARMEVRRLGMAAMAYYAEFGKLPEPAPPTPAEIPCGSGDRKPAAPDLWAHPAWQALSFATPDHPRYQYSFVTSPTGFTARALGDLDCDGVLSTFEVSGEVRDGELSLTPGIQTRDELE